MVIDDLAGGLSTFSSIFAAFCCAFRSGESWENVCAEVLGAIRDA
jgi:hypothetical protein